MKIIAHRGDSSKAPDNTMEAFQAAYESGVFGFEFDVRLSADNIPIVHHHMMVSHDEREGFVDDFTVEQLQSIPIVYNDRSYQIPLLEDVLEAYAGKTYLEIHVQSASRTAIHAISPLLKHFHNYRDLIEITSYEPAILLGIQEMCPGIACDLLFHPEDWMTEEMIVRVMLEKARLASAKGVHIFHEQASSAIVKRFRTHGFDVHCGLVNDQQAFKRIEVAGIQQFCTDNIHLFM